MVHGVPYEVEAPRGMTFLEVVVAMALFGVVASAIIGVFSFTMGSQLREQRTLACAEVGNRLVLAYLDDRTTMPDPNKTLEYGPDDHPIKFRWEYREDPITLVESGADARDHSRTSPLRQDRFRQITVHVWLAEESGGSFHAEDWTPQVTLTRMFDPLYTRNPDSFMKVMTDPANLRRFMDDMQGNYHNAGNAAPPAHPTPITRPPTQNGGGRGTSLQPGGAFGKGKPVPIGKKAGQ